MATIDPRDGSSDEGWSFTTGRFDAGMPPMTALRNIEREMSDPEANDHRYNLRLLLDEAVDLLRDGLSPKPVHAWDPKQVRLALTILKELGCPG